MKSLLIVLLLCSPAVAGNRYYHPYRTRSIIVYTVPLYQPVITRGSNWGLNKMPYNPVYSARNVTARPANRPGPTVTHSRYYSPAPVEPPQLIINPYVDQTPYKGLGR